MTKNTDTSMLALLANEVGYDPIEDRLRQNIRATIEALFEEELAAFIGRCRYGRGGTAKKGYRNGHRERQLVGTFGTETVSVPRARIENEEGKITEWQSKALPRYQRLTKKAEAPDRLGLSGRNEHAAGQTRALRPVSGGSRQGRGQPGLAQGEGGLGRVVRPQSGRRRYRPSHSGRHRHQDPTRPQGHEHLGAGGHRCAPGWPEGSVIHHEYGWREQGRLGPVPRRSRCARLKRPELVIIDGAPGLEAALVALWGEDLAVQRCTVHKHRNLLGHAPKTMHDELTEDYRDMIYADTAVEVEKRRKAFLRKWRLKCKAVADSLEEAGDRLFTFTRLEPSQWKSARTTNAIERLNEEFRRRVKTQTVLPCAETVPMLLWALMASGQIQMRKVDGWETLDQPIEPITLDLVA